MRGAEVEASHAAPSERELSVTDETAEFRVTRAMARPSNGRLSA
jgi:hypothetical protein